MAAARKRIAPSRPVPGGYRRVLDPSVTHPRGRQQGCRACQVRSIRCKVVFPAPFGLAAGVNAGMLLLLTEVPAVIDGSSIRMPGAIRHAPQEQTEGPEDMAHMTLRGSCQAPEW